MLRTPMPTTKTGLRQRITVPKEVIDVLRWHVETQLKTAEQHSRSSLPARGRRLLHRLWIQEGLRRGRWPDWVEEEVHPARHASNVQRHVPAAKVESLVTKSISGHPTGRMKDQYSTVSPVEQRESIGRVLRLVTDAGGAPTASSGAPDAERVA
jgi:hypothetical protein